MGAKVLGLSLDDVASQAKFVEQQGLNFPLLSDPDGSAAARLGAMMKDKPYAARVTFLVDDAGILRAIDSGVKVDSHGKDVVEAIRAARGK